MNRSRYALLAAGAVVALLTAGLLRSRGRETSPPANLAVLDSEVLAAPGRVEAASEEVRVSSELSGRLKAVNVEEGDRVRRGQVLAEIQNDDYHARVREAEAELAEREAELRRTVNGARTQERSEAAAAMQAAEAVLNNAKREAERRRGLADRSMVSREEADRFERARQVAQAQYEEAAQHFSLVDADAREEEAALARKPPWRRRKHGLRRRGPILEKPTSGRRLVA